MKRKVLKFVRMGEVERWNKGVRGLTWRPAYALLTDTGNPTYGWMTRAEARSMAKRDGGRAAFYETTEAARSAR